jgi:hypothetical protein
MLLTTANLFYYLGDQGLLPDGAASVVASDLWIVPDVRRNRTFQVIRRGGDGLFIKQARSWAPDAVASLAAEAHWLTRFRDDPALAPSAALAPRLLYYDADRYVLVLELIADAQTLTAAPGGILAPGPAGHLGATLGGAQQALAADPLQNQEPGTCPPAPRPWILHPPTPAVASGISPGQAHALAILQRYPAFGSGLAALAAAWQTTTLIHGDLKGDNCLLSAPAAGGEAPLIRLVDWEFAGWGDPAWDAGTLLAGWLAAWATAGPDPPAPSVALQPSARAFWAAYTTARGDSGAEANQLRERAAGYAAARLAQSAYEVLHEAPQLSPPAVRLLQLSHNLLADPAAALHSLLALA